MDAIKALLNKDVLGGITRISEDSTLKPDQSLVFADSSEDAISITLPSKAQAAGKTYIIHAPAGATNDVSILDNESGSEVSGGDLDADDDYAVLFCTGRDWCILGTSIPGYALPVADKVQTITTTAAAIEPLAELVQLNKSDGVLASTLTAPAAGRFLVITQIDAGTSGHTVTLAAGTFDGTNEIATFNAAGETLVLYGLTATRFAVVENLGAVAFSTAG
jgi:hypothetical protein